MYRVWRVAVLGPKKLLVLENQMERKMKHEVKTWVFMGFQFFCGSTWLLGGLIK